MLFTLSAIGMVSWNVFRPQDVHQQTWFLDRAAIGSVSGALLAFFGLSIVKLRSWFSGLANLAGLWKYPELHVKPETAAFLTSSAGTVFTCITVTLSLLIPVLEYSIPLPTDGRDDSDLILPCLAAAAQRRLHYDALHPWSWLIT